MPKSEMFGGAICSQVGGAIPVHILLCDTSANLWQKVSRHSAERVVDDMLRLHLDHGIDAFYTIDDVFSLDRERVVDICHGLIKHNHNIHWTIQTRGDLIDLDLLKLMKRAGCVGVKMGIESGVDRILKYPKRRLETNF